MEPDLIETFEKAYTPFCECETQAEREDWYETLGAFKMGWEAYRRTAAPDTSALAAARAVIAAFVYPHAPMTPAQRETWEAWEKLNDKETETK